ncbi:hypothetical protein [Anaerospora hongkongensis]|uniref:hypothetical protein n=1 Tax=Anaerospora hongkongensis TaxID=244830 RepID=UPI0028967693|nr:hypothetical protein [Anaerospora hongkongensis]
MFASRDNRVNKSNRQSLEQIIQVLQPSWVAQGLTAVGAIAIAISAIATALMVKEMKDTREEASRPYIVVDFIYKKNVRALYLVLRNTGKTIACNVRLQSEPLILGKSIKGDSLTKVDILNDRFGTGFNL